MRQRQTGRGRTPGTATRGISGPFARTLERQIEDIMLQVAPRRAPDGQNRGVVTVLFVGINDFVALCEDREPPEVGAILDVYVQMVADSVGKFLGTVQGIMGDLVMATWNATYPQADHALLAVNSAVDLMERMEDVQQRLHMFSLPSITYTAGVNTGDALVRRVGVGRNDNDVIGDTVNIAQLLSRLPCESAILVGEGTYVSIGEQILMEGPESVELTGKRKPINAFRVIGRVSPM